MPDSVAGFGNMKVNEIDGTSYFPAFPEAFELTGSCTG